MIRNEGRRERDYDERREEEGRKDGKVEKRE